jgi:Family of unknown function (DUF6502)
MPAPTPDSPDQDDALTQALQEVLGPLARLAVEHGVRHGVIEELLRQNFVDAARHSIRTQHPDILPHRMVSRISTVTGLNRREVTRLTQTETPAARARPSVASEVFTRWMSERQYRHRNGQIKALPRQGEAPSFEALAQSVTRDVHPRSLLDELLRLDLARVDADTDMVHLTREAFVPKGDRARMLGFLGENVGDHLHAAVDNVLHPDDTPHFEQAIWANALSSEAAAQVKPLLRQQWQSLLKLLTPELEALLEADRAEGRMASQRLRIGLYSYTGPANDAPAADDTPS